MNAKLKLEEEVRKLEQELKIDLPRELGQAAALGDLRENGEYQAARERQNYVRTRLGELRRRLGELSMVNFEQLPRDRAAYGSTLVVMDLDKNIEVTYKLVTQEEADATKGWLSTVSPLGRSFMSRQEGDEVDVQTPQGIRRFEVIKLLTIHDCD